MSAFNPYAPPQAPVPTSGGGYGGAFAQLQGDMLVVSKDAPLPDVCVKCAAHAVTRRKQRFVFTPQWVIFIMLISPVIGAVVAMIVQKKGTLELPLCEQCARRWKSANVQIVLAIVGLFVAIGLGLYIGIGIEQPVVMIVFLLLGLGGLIAVAIVNKDVRVMSKKVDDTSITLTKVHPEACRAIVHAFNR
ncbi:MAG: hypothetical protein ABI175_07950 [Polyangiales bacterium]